MIVNLTPHEVNIGSLTIPSSGVARLAAKIVSAGNFEGVPLTRTEFGKPEGLPEAEEGTLLIVSQLIKSALPERTDLVVPAELVRDDKGVIIGCRSLGI